jgi:hypothetical protein
MKTGDYSNTHFYRIVCKDTSIKEEYIGHTTNVRLRKASHKYCCNNQNDRRRNLRVYQFIREHGGWDNWDMVLIETKSFENILQVYTHERYLIESRKSSLNYNIPNHTDQEYYEKNKDKILNKREKYRNNNKEQIKMYHSEYYKHKREEIKIKSKTYYETNKEHIQKRRKLYSLKKKQEREQENL